MRAPRRRSAKQNRLIAGGEPLACWCGSTEWEVAWATFPMHHVSTCKGCGVEYKGELKLTAPKQPKPKPPEGPPFFDGWPPFFYP